MRGVRTTAARGTLPRVLGRAGAVIIAALGIAAMGASYSSVARAEDPAQEKAVWRSLATDDAKVWEPCNFGGDGEVTLGKEAIRLGLGDPLTGVRCVAEIPRDQYEIQLESRRLSNFDFFCGLTFPVGEGHCSLILGGWAGAVVGLSNVDGRDASDNATKRLMTFENERWYRVRVRVEPKAIRCWVDDELVVDQPREGHTFDIRAEMDPSLPLGVAAFQCEAELRNVRLRKLGEDS